MRVEIFYDTSCSWSRLGRINFGKAVSKLEKEGKINPDELEIIYRSYVNYPDVPEAGLDYRQALLDGGDLEKVDPKHNTPIHRWGRRAGIEFNFEKIKIRPNTFLAHQFLQMFLREKKGDFEQLLSDIQFEYFENGTNINGLDKVVELSRKYIGFDKSEELRRRALHGECKADVDEDIEIADNYNISLVPLYVFDGKVKLEGGILQEKFEDALLRNIEPNI